MFGAIYLYVTAKNQHIWRGPWSFDKIIPVSIALNLRPLQQPQFPLPSVAVILVAVAVQVILDKIVISFFFNLRLLHGNLVQNQLTSCKEILILWHHKPKMQHTKMLFTCHRFGDLFLYGLVWQYSSVQTKCILIC